jgi:hypothetical protein
MTRSIAVCLLAAIAIASCKRGPDCARLGSEAADILASHVLTEEGSAHTARADADRLASQLAASETERTSSLDRLKILRGVMGCASSDSCCRDLARESGKARQHSANAIGSAALKLTDHFASTPLRAEIAEVSATAASVAKLLQTTPRGEGQVERACQTVVASIARIEKASDAAWDGVLREQTAKLEAARAAQKEQARRVAQMEAWQDAIVHGKPLEVPENAGEPGASDGFRRTRAALRRAALCRD